MRPRFPLLLATAATSLVALTGCSTDPAPATTSVTAATAAGPAASMATALAPPAEVATPGLSVTDETLAATLTAALARDPALRSKTGPSVRVSVVGGQVTLQGNVRSLRAKRRAAAIVSGMRGATALVDQLVVDAPVRLDADIARDVERSIRLEATTPTAHVAPTVSAGIVTLRGTVSSSRQRERIEDDVVRVPGVRGVTLFVSLPAIKRAPAAVGAEVNDRLRDDARLVGSHVLVSVQGRAATLSGVVASLAQRGAAVDDARVAGVDNVEASALQVDPGEIDRAVHTLAASVADDGHIGDVVQRDLASDERVGRPAPEVRVEHGVVTLSGNVGDFRAERAAVRDANQVRGVRRVDDRTSVAPALLENDATIQSQVERSVLNDLEAPDAPHLQITTAQAKVMLRGAVFSPEERQVIEGDVEAVPGVVSVENDLTVDGYAAEVGTPTHPALRIQVIETIFWDARVESGKVTVAATADGAVTLSGRVDTPEEAKSAVEDANRAGAVRVLDRMTIAGG